MPVFGGWLRNVEDEGMSIGWPYIRTLARRSEELGYDLTLIAELNLNDIKGMQAPSLDAWSTAAAVAAVTTQLEVMVAVRPTFHPPALMAKQAASLDQLCGGRLTMNVVSSWWAEEARMYGVAFDQHDDRYARTSEWLDVVDGLWKTPRFSYAGRFYQINNAVLEPKPLARPRPCVYAGGESEAAKNLIAEKADAYLMHGDPRSALRRRLPICRRDGKSSASRR
jgi:FMNH2-dependent dimethyl sulfone monooxygenase